MGRFLWIVAFLAISGCSDEPTSNPGDNNSVGVVTGFGGPGGRSGRVNVYFKSGDAQGVIRGVAAAELSCRVGDRIPVSKSGLVVTASPNACGSGLVL